MISIIADTHTHTIVCDHAFSTLRENITVAAQKGLKAIAMTEHGPALLGAPTKIHFDTLVFLPRYMQGVMILRGAEANIVNFDGALDLDERRLGNLEWVIASYHYLAISPGTEAEHTRGWMNIANNPNIDVIGHPDDPRYPFDFKTVIKEFARAGKMVEINGHSPLGRPGSEKNGKVIATLCAEYGVSVVVSSDAHYCDQIGHFGPGTALLQEIGFPEELIVNADYDRFVTKAREVSGKTLDDNEKSLYMGGPE